MEACFEDTEERTKLVNQIGGLNIMVDLLGGGGKATGTERGEEEEARGEREDEREREEGGGGVGEGREVDWQGRDMSS